MTTMYRELEGAVVFWDLARATDPGVVSQGLENAGLEDIKFTKRSKNASLRAALKEMYGSRMIDRVMGGFTVVEKKKKDRDQNEYDTEMCARLIPGADEDGDSLEVSQRFRWGGSEYRVTLKESGNCTVEEEFKNGGSSEWHVTYSYSYDATHVHLEELQKDLPKLAERYRWWRSMLAAKDLSVGLVQAVKQLGGTPRTSGGRFYHLADEKSVQKMRDLERVLIAAARVGQNSITFDILMACPENIANLRKKAEEQLGQEVASIMDEITQNELTEAAMEKQLERLKVLSKRSQDYRRCLGESLRITDMMIAQAEKLTGVAVAVQEAEVFDDLMGI